MMLKRFINGEVRSVNKATLDNKLKDGDDFQS